MTETRRNGRPIATTLVLASLLLSVVGTAPAGAARLPYRPSAAGVDATAVRLRVGQDAWELLRLTNAARERRGLATLRLDREGSRIARRHSAAMAAAGELFHTTNVSPYLDDVDWRRWGENVGYSPGSIQTLQEAFMNSEGHRRNVLDPAFRRVAIGTVRADGAVWVTLFFYG